MNIIKFQNGSWCFDEYFDYLNKHLEEIPVEIRGFLTDYSRYSLSDSTTLHDSILLDVRSNLTKKGQCAIIKLEGPYSDRIFSFRFHGVSKIDFGKQNSLIKNIDLIAFQFEILKNDLFRMEFIFDSNSLKIEFNKLIISETKKVSASNKRINLP
ncbi:hypothetical protein [Phocaeicola sartorii]|uniref:Uncharacterized protein n=1 Tax=Phocaeicola sartorii TaxID=671267 RepID=R9HZF4_9BACT|nr:hypothetical protein [Phocaeicola sartorii]EOS09171.1 hypothetical protein C802_03916 [Phocaeicola sartorii]MCR1846912.1 hypothetical protein [Phocaeicola sartorii]